MKRITEEILGLSGFRSFIYGYWLTLKDADSRLRFNNFNPLENTHNLISDVVRYKIYSEIHKIVFDKTKNRNITENYEKNN